MIIYLSILFLGCSEDDSIEVRAESAVLVCYDKGSLVYASRTKAEDIPQLKEWRSECNDRFVKDITEYNAKYEERLEKWLGYCYPPILRNGQIDMVSEGYTRIEEIKLKTGIQDLSVFSADQIVKENRENALKNILAGIATTEEEKKCSASLLESENYNRPRNVCTEHRLTPRLEGEFTYFVDSYDDDKVFKSYTLKCFSRSHLGDE